MGWWPCCCECEYADLNPVILPVGAYTGPDPEVITGDWTRPLLADILATNDVGAELEFLSDGDGNAIQVYWDVYLYAAGDEITLKLAYVDELNFIMVAVTRATTYTGIIEVVQRAAGVDTTLAELSLSSVSAGTWELYMLVCLFTTAGQPVIQVGAWKSGNVTYYPRQGYPTGIASTVTRIKCTGIGSQVGIERVLLRYHQSTKSHCTSCGGICGYCRFGAAPDEVEVQLAGIICRATGLPSDLNGTFILPNVWPSCAYQFFVVGTDCDDSILDVVRLDFSVGAAASWFQVYEYNFGVRAQLGVPDAVRDRCLEWDETELELVATDDATSPCDFSNMTATLTSVL